MSGTVPKASEVLFRLFFFVNIFSQRQHNIAKVRFFRFFMLNLQNEFFNYAENLRIQYPV